MESLDIISPVYNEEDCIEKFVEEIEKLKKRLENKLEISVIFINDGSYDNSLNILKKIAQDNKYIKIINLSRNFGQENAIMAGLNLSNADYACIIDADLQDPPSFIKNLYEKSLEGYDIVFAKRKKRENETILKKLTSYMFYRFFNWISDFKIQEDTGYFVLLSKKVIRAMNCINEKKRFTKGILSYVGYKSASITFLRDGRYLGKTKYNYFRLINLALNGICSFSTKPLKFAAGLGITITLFSLIYIMYVFYLKFFTNTTVPGYASFMCVVLFLGGLNIFVTGIVGIYISYIFNEVKDRPIYFIDEKINF